MDSNFSFNFPSSHSATAPSSPSTTPRRSSHRRSQAVTVPAIATVSLRTPLTYTPPRTYHRTTARHSGLNNLASIPEGPSGPGPRPAPSSALLSPRLGVSARPSYFRSTSSDSVTTTDSTPESCRFVNSPSLSPSLGFDFPFTNYTTSNRPSSALEPFPRLSMCDIDEEMGLDADAAIDDDEEFWHCAGIARRESLKKAVPIIIGQVEVEMKDVGMDAAVYDRVRAWRDSL